MPPAYESPRDGVRLADRYTLSGQSRDRGLGDVWIARDDRTNRAERIVKFHPLGATSEADAQALVARLKGVTATGFAAVLDGGAWQGRLFLVHDACAGRSLRHWIDGWSTTLTPPAQGVLKALFLALCSALHEAHRSDFAHERLTPRSVVITSVKSPRPLVVFDGGVSPVLSGDDQALCADYLAPEQAERAKKGAATDPKRADLFALGVILGELLTLRSTPRPGTRETWEQLLRNNPRKPLSALIARPVDTPEAVWQLVDRLLFNRNDPEFANASKVRRAARTAWESAGVVDESPESLREAPLPVAQPAAARPPNQPASPRSESPREPAQPAAQPAKAAVVKAFSVPVAMPAPTPPREPTPAPVEARPTPSPPRASPPPASPRPPAPLASSVGAPASHARAVGGDTLVDPYDDDESTDVVGQKELRAFAPKPIDAAPKVVNDLGVDTLPVANAPVFDEAPQHGTTANTLIAEPPPSRVSAPSGVRFASEPSPSDPFAGRRTSGTDTVGIDDLLSPLVAASDGGRPSPVGNQTIEGRALPIYAQDSEEQKTMPIVPGARSPVARDRGAAAVTPFVPLNSPTNTLPMEMDAAPFAPVAPQSPAPRGAPVRMNLPTAERTSQLPAQRDGASSWDVRLMLGVVVAGVLLGMLITLALRGR